MKKEDLEGRTFFEEKITRWTANCIWSGILAGPIVSTIAYSMVSNSKQELGFYTPSDGKTLLVVLGSFIISGLAVGSVYSFIRRKQVDIE